MASTGETIAHYRILEKLGGGGMGVVYQAHNTLMDRDEVLKVMSRDLMSRAGAVERFLKEVKAELSAAAAQLQAIARLRKRK